MMKITFNNVSVYKNGLIEDLLEEAYRHIPTTTREDRQSFHQFDQDVSEHPQWVGKYVFISTLDHIPIGFVSFDPRQKPLAIIGHNCILPAHKGKGLGKQQMIHALTEIKKQGFTKAVVSTCAIEDFVPAQKMYLSCGFTETGKFYKEDTEMIGYELHFTE